MGDGLTAIDYHRTFIKVAPAYEPYQNLNVLVKSF